MIQLTHNFLHTSKVGRVQWLLSLFAFAVFSAAAQNSTSGTNSLSRIIEASGVVEISTPADRVWRITSVGQGLAPGDRLRTHALSRAAVQLSDRSVIRLNERTTLELLPPRIAGKARFRLPVGSLFFFDREKPADIEFDTPLASGAIRGTEFLLEVSEADTALHLVLLDGLVGLMPGTSTNEVAIHTGEEASLLPGQPIKKTALLDSVAPIQWAIYYPAVVDPDELELSIDEQHLFAKALAHYRAGDLLQAVAALPPSAPDESPGIRILRAAVILAVGRVDQSEALLRAAASDIPTVVALRELIAVSKGSPQTNSHPQSASEWLARSYSLQSQANLPGSIEAAKNAVNLSAAFGFAHSRLAELEFAFEHTTPALISLKRALELSPRLAAAHALHGFVLLARDQIGPAIDSFDRARTLDAALGSAWLGLGLCAFRQSNPVEARFDFQAAAALEPKGGLYRSYLGKAASSLRDSAAAAKEFALAKRLDPKDPTAWLYSALHLWQENRINAALRDLEQSLELNDQRALFRSRLLLDRDRSVRSANLAAIYQDAGLADVSRHLAGQSVSESYANFSGHLFLANSLQSREDPNHFNQRLETARQAELLLANLLAPPGAGNLSQQLSQQDHLQFFDPRTFGLSSLSEYTSNGDWRESATVFGTVGGLSYAIDSLYENLNGQNPNSESERRQFTVSLKQRVTASDEVYFQVGQLDSTAGDVAAYYDPSSAKADFSVHEKQEPTLYAGWHHAWSPGNHTLLLLARLDDSLTLHDARPNLLFLRQSGGVPIGLEEPPFFNWDFASQVTLYSAELQQIWETERQSLIVGGRFQRGTVNSQAALTRIFGGSLPGDSVAESLERENAYAYYTIRIADPLRFVVGVSYDHLSYPKNSDFAPLSPGTSSEDLLAPKAGLFYTPWQRGEFHASYTRSLGGLFFDNSVRLEPTQVGGFNQAFRSLIPESVEGLVPGTRFETVSIGFDQSLKTGTFLGIETEWLASQGDRTLGLLTNTGLPPFPDSVSSTQQELHLRERNLSLYAAQLLGDYFSASLRYRLGDDTLHTTLPNIPSSTPGLSQQQQKDRAILHRISLSANFNHPSGLFGQWDSTLYQQSNQGYVPDRPGDTFWIHNLLLGYRFPHRLAEIRISVLNIANTDYRLDPLSSQLEMPRTRTLATSLRLNF